MDKYIYTTDGSKLINVVQDNPVQGVDFCSFCKEDLYLFGGQSCPSSQTGHKWIELQKNS